jgi:FkbM family methyltransferase
VKIVRGWAFPDADQFMVNELKVDGTYQLTHLEAALRHVTNFTVAIDGGAHVGTWSKVLATRFARVIAIEPSPDTFACLEWNLTQAGCANVERRSVALGEAPGVVTMALDAANAARANTGARFARAGGSIPVQTIDSWQLESVGFLKLDIEGSEPMAIEGARETIARCRPIVLFEDKRLWSRHFGLPKDAVGRLLAAMGYRPIESVGRDAIWGPA